MINKKEHQASSHKKHDSHDHHEEQGKDKDENEYGHSSAEQKDQA